MLAGLLNRQQVNLAAILLAVVLRQVTESN